MSLFPSTMSGGQTGDCLKCLFLFFTLCFHFSQSAVPHMPVTFLYCQVLFTHVLHATSMCNVFLNNSVTC